jgi:hypothetical protein
LSGHHPHLDSNLGPNQTRLPTGLLLPHISSSVTMPSILALRSRDQWYQAAPRPRKWQGRIHSREQRRREQGSKDSDGRVGESEGFGSRTFMLMYYYLQVIPYREQSRTSQNLAGRYPLPLPSPVAPHFPAKLQPTILRLCAMSPEGHRVRYDQMRAFMSPEPVAK